MSISLGCRGFFGVSEAWGGERSSLQGLPMRPFFWPWRSTPCFAPSEASAPDSWPRLPHPSWATTKERAAWRFGA